MTAAEPLMPGGESATDQLRRVTVEMEAIRDARDFYRQERDELRAEVERLVDVGSKAMKERAEAVSLLAQIGDALSPTGERPEEALGTLVADVVALVEQRDEALVAQARIGDRMTEDVVRLTAYRREHVLLRAEPASARTELERLRSTTPTSKEKST